MNHGTSIARSVGLLAGAALIAIAMLSLPGVAAASPGNLDPGFGTRGVVKLFVAPGPPEANAVAIQADGKIVIAGTDDLFEGPDDTSRFVLARFDPNGELDRAFGHDGVVTTDFTPYRDHAYGLAIQPDGRIVASGVVGEGGPNAAFGVARYTTAGRLDRSFGDDGKVTTNFSPLDDYGNAVAVERSGKIVVGGLARCCGDAWFAVARYDTNGHLDTSFGGGDGKATIDPTTAPDFGFSVAIAPGGRIVLGGVAGLGSSDQSFGLARFTPHGTPDGTFGRHGVVTTSVPGTGDWCTSIVIARNADVVALGTGGGADSAFDLVRYRSDGAIARTFGSDGLVTTKFTDMSDSPAKLVTAAGGRLLAIGGSAFTGGGSFGRFALVRYHADGRPDTSFGRNGKVTVDLTRFDDIGLAVAIQADGKIVGVGDAGIGGDRPRIAVIRLLAS